MKKAFAILLALVCLAALLLVPVQAEDTPDKVSLFKEGLQWAYPFCEYFDSSSAPHQFISLEIQRACNSEGVLSEYCTYSYWQEEENPYLAGTVKAAVCEIPAEVLESFAGRHFTNKAAVRNVLRRDSNANGMGYLNALTYADGMYHIDLNFGGFGDLYPELYYLGYREVEANRYEVYLYLIAAWEIAEDYNYVDYVPGEDDVEGEDYVIVSTALDGGTTTQYMRMEDYGLKAVMSIEDGTYAFTSYEQIARADIPADSLTLEEKTLAVETRKDGVTLTAAPAEVPVGTHLAVAAITDADEIGTFNACMTNGETAVAAYHFTAMDAENAIIADFRATVTVRLPIPAGVTDPTLYYISDDGNTVEEIPGSVEGDEFVCTLSHFSTYVLAQKKAEPQPPVQTPTQTPTSGPEGSSPAPSMDTSNGPTDNTPEPTWLWIAAGIATAAAVAAAVILLRKKK